MSAKEPITAPIPENDELAYEEWGNGLIYITEGEKTGAWVGYDPETDAVDLSEWR